MTVRIRFRDEGEVFETLILEDRADVGPEIRQINAPGCEAGTFQAIDVAMGHCPCCIGIEDEPVGHILGLTSGELGILSRWRTRKADGVSSGEIARILDKLIAALTQDKLCETEVKRIVVEVEPTP